MAKKPAAWGSSGDSMSDPFLDNWNSGMDGMDVPFQPTGNSKPSKTSTKLVTAFLKGLVGKGLAQGAYNGLTRDMPHTRDAVDEVFRTWDDLRTMKNDFVQQAGPSVNTLKTVTASALPHVRKLMPKKLYTKLQDMLTVENEYGLPSRDAQQGAEIADAMAQIFSEAQAQQMEQTGTQNLVNQALDSTRHKDQMGALSGIQAAMMFQAQWTKKTYTAYLKKSLELQYKHLFVAKDSLATQQLMLKIIEVKLEEIKKNTGLPDFFKASTADMIKAQLQQSKATRYADYIGKFRENAMKKVKSVVFDQAQNALGMLAMMGSGASMAGSMGGMGGPSLGEMAAGGVGDFVGGLAGEAAGGKMGKIAGPAARNMERVMKNFRARGMVKMQNWKDKQQRDPSAGWMKSMLADLIPDVNKNVTIENDLMKNGEKPSVFDKMTRASIVEVIPGYLAKMTKYLADISTGKQDHEELVFDPNSRDFVTASKMQKNLSKMAFGDPATRGAKTARAIGALEAAGRVNATAGTVDELPQMREQMEQFFLNHAIGFKELDWEALVAYAKSDPVTAPLDGGQEHYVTVVFDGIDEDKRALIARLVSASLTKEDGSVDMGAKATVDNYILDLMGEDAYKDIMPRMSETFGMRRLYNKTFAPGTNTVSQRYLKTNMSGSQTNPDFDRTVTDTSNRETEAMAKERKEMEVLNQQLGLGLDGTDAGKLSDQFIQWTGATGGEQTLIRSIAFMFANAGEGISAAASRIAGMSKEDLQKFKDQWLEADKKRRAEAWKKRQEAEAKLSYDPSGTATGPDEFGYNDAPSAPPAPPTAPPTTPPSTSPPPPAGPPVTGFSVQFPATVMAYLKTMAEKSTIMGDHLTQSLFAQKDVSASRVFLVGFSDEIQKALDKLTGNTAVASIDPEMIPVWARPDLDGSFHNELKKFHTGATSYFTNSLQLQTEILEQLRAGITLNGGGTASTGGGSSGKWKAKLGQFKTWMGNKLGAAKGLLMKNPAETGFVDVFVKGNLTAPVLTVTQQAMGCMTESGKKVNVSADIDGPVKSLDGTKTFIDAAMVAKGLVDSTGRPIAKKSIMGALQGGIKSFAKAIPGKLDAMKKAMSRYPAETGYIDVYVRGNLATPVLTAAQQRVGVFGDDGKPILTSSQIKGPVYGVKGGSIDMTVMLITPQQVALGLVDKEGNPINRRSMAMAAKGAAGMMMGAALAGLKNVGSKLKGLFSGGMGKLGDMMKGWGVKYVDIYRKDKLTPGSPLLTAKAQEAGVFFADGKKLAASKDLVKPVFGPPPPGATNGVLLVSEDDIKAGLVDASGKPITGGGAGKFMEGAKKILGGLAGGAGGLLGKLGGSIKDLLTGGKGGAGGGGLLSQLLGGAKAGLGKLWEGAKGIGSNIWGALTGKGKDKYKPITDRLDTIIDILKNWEKREKRRDEAAEAEHRARDLNQFSEMDTGGSDPNQRSGDSDQDDPDDSPHGGSESKKPSFWKRAAGYLLPGGSATVGWKGNLARMGRMGRHLKAGRFRKAFGMTKLGSLGRAARVGKHAKLLSGAGRAAGVAGKVAGVAGVALAGYGAAKTLFQNQADYDRESAERADKYNLAGGQGAWAKTKAYAGLAINPLEQGKVIATAHRTANEAVIGTVKGWAKNRAADNAQSAAYKKLFTQYDGEAKDQVNGLLSKLDKDDSADNARKLYEQYRQIIKKYPTKGMQELEKKQKADKAAEDAKKLATPVKPEPKKETVPDITPKAMGAMYKDALTAKTPEERAKILAQMAASTAPAAAAQAGAENAKPVATGTEGAKAAMKAPTPTSPKPGVDPSVAQMKAMTGGLTASKDAIAKSGEQTTKSVDGVKTAVDGLADPLNAVAENTQGLKQLPNILKQMLALAAAGQAGAGAAAPRGGSTRSSNTISVRRVAYQSP